MLGLTSNYYQKSLTIEQPHLKIELCDPNTGKHNTKPFWLVDTEEKNGIVISYTPGCILEFAMQKSLLHPDDPFNAVARLEEISSNVFGYKVLTKATANSINVHVHKIRSEIEPEKGLEKYLQTIIDWGYHAGDPSEFDQDIGRGIIYNRMLHTMTNGHGPRSIGFLASRALDALLDNAYQPKELAEILKWQNTDHMSQIVFHINRAAGFRLVSYDRSEGYHLNR